MSDRARRISIWDPGIVRQAAIDALWKLDPRIQFKNPVMFIVEVGSDQGAAAIDQLVTRQADELIDEGKERPPERCVHAVTKLR